MSRQPANQQQLIAENRDLRARLENAEATLREILNGESDALLVTGLAGAQLFTLKGADQSYRTLIENMSEGALTLTPQGLVLYANQRLAGMLGMPLEKVIGSEIYTWVAPASRQVLQTLLQNDMVENRREELALASADGTQVPVYLSVSRQQQDGMPDSICMIATDLTEQKRNEAIVAADKLEQAILEQAADAIVICDEAGRIIRASKQAQAFYGKDLIGQRFKHAFPLHQPDGSAFLPVGGGDTEHLHLVEARLTRLGQGHDFLVSVGHLIGAQSHLIGSVVTLTDITERKAAEVRIKYLSRIHAVLSGINSLIVRAKNRDELFREACNIAIEAGEFRMVMVVGVDRRTMKLIPVASAGEDEKFITMVKDCLSSVEDASTTMVGMAILKKQPIVSNDTLNDSRVVFRTQYIDAGIRSFVALPLIVSGEAVGAISLYTRELDFFHQEEMKLLPELAGDIAFAIDHIDKREKLDYLAYYDALTGLANRTLFLERLAQYMRSAASRRLKLALCLIDLERFRNINDSLGRAAGDSLLRQVAQWLTIGTGDVTLLAHIDADHFAIVLPEIRQATDVIRQIDKMAQAFYEHPFRLNDADFRIAAKGGVALFPDDSDDAETLFKKAEAALKKAKTSGDRYLFYTQEMTEAVAGKLTLENQLRQAIDNEEFVLYYQPKVNIASGKVTSAEALIRWKDPRTDLVLPSEFIPILEETGLINEVGRWALRKAIADNLRWRSAGLPAVRIAVNVSALQLHSQSFLAEIEQAIAIDANAAEGLEVEITESLVMDDVERNISILQAVRAMGITIAIDDFGTGFSSLSYLAKLPVTTLKIDRSFIIEMTAGPTGLALVSTIISLAHAFKLKVVAEGVDTEEQSHLLRLLNCDEIQGFLFSEPVPADVFEAKFLVP